MEAVAYHLELEWRRLGVETARFTLAEAGGGWLPSVGGGLRGKLALAGRVLWFSTIGTVLARRMLARQPEATVSICHNDAVAGDVYVNHGIVAVAMKARGHQWLRMLRNPLHVLTWLRDTARYSSRAHQVVVNLTVHEDALLRQTYRRVHPRTVVIGNGVDTDRFAPDAARRAGMRASLGVVADDDLAVFVGHEYSRKGLPLVLEAMEEVAGLRLVVVGGTPEMIADAGRDVAERGLGQRVSFVGRQADPTGYLVAADLLVLPSAYEAYPLVVLEALACGVPVVATAVGSVPEIIVDGRNGAIVERTAASVAAGIRRVLAGDRDALAAESRATALGRSWSVVAKDYLRLFESLTGSVE